MDIEELESRIETALQHDKATYEVSQQDDALILSIPDGSDFLIAPLDELFAQGMEEQDPADSPNGMCTVPTFKIAGYWVSPKFSHKQVHKSLHQYCFIYAP